VKMSPALDRRESFSGVETPRAWSIPQHGGTRIGADAANALSKATRLRRHGATSDRRAGAAHAECVETAVG
jgi:hypothetical protein